MLNRPIKGPGYPSHKPRVAEIPAEALTACEEYKAACRAERRVEVATKFFQSWAGNLISQSVRAAGTATEVRLPPNAADYCRAAFLLADVFLGVAEVRATDAPPVMSEECGVDSEGGEAA